ncbi:Hypothetical predicted protein [Paramuricea clavata]|uniref:Uncharacterized protein n=1 Tax=Paramuricea clavata TaxID=317549 RepID=A0A6S7G5K7_PARCT|nr:Hypothetical predicted protein [Paramuricea clavata]
MDEVEAKKQERSKSKMAVTRTSRRLIDATHRDVDFETLKGFIVELEKVYDEFCIITDEYELLVSDEKFVEHRVVNGDDITTYNANVKQTYVEARDVYVKIKAENERSKQSIAMAPLMTALRRDMNRLQDIISAVDDSLSQEAPSSESLQMDKSDMENLLNEMCDKINKLTAIQPDIYLPSDVEAIMGTAYNKIRKINLNLKKNQAPKVPVILPNDEECPKNTEGMLTNLTPPVTSDVHTIAGGSTLEPVGPSTPNSLPTSLSADMSPVKPTAPGVGSTMNVTPTPSGTLTIQDPQNPSTSQIVCHGAPVMAAGCAFLSLLIKL